MNKEEISKNNPEKELIKDKSISNNKNNEINNKNKTHNKKVEAKNDKPIKSLDEIYKDILDVATKYVKIFKDIPYVFNLGHGLLPETDPDKVKMLVNFYRNLNE